MTINTETPTGLWAQNKKLWNAQPWIEHEYLAPPWQAQRSEQKRRQKGCENQRWWRTSKKLFSGTKTVACRNSWQLWYMPKKCTNSRQRKFQQGGTTESGKISPQNEELLRVGSGWEESQFSLMVWSMVRWTHSKQAPLSKVAGQHECAQWVYKEE